MSIWTRFFGRGSTPDAESLPAGDDLPESLEKQILEEIDVQLFAAEFAGAFRQIDEGSKMEDMTDADLKSYLGELYARVESKVKPRFNLRSDQFRGLFIRAYKDHIGSS